MTDWNQVREWASFLLPLGVGFYSWLMNQQSATAKDVAQLRKEVEATSGRVDVFSERVKHLPDSGEFGGVSTNVHVLDERLKSVNETIKQLREDLREYRETSRQEYARIDQFMRKEFG